MNLPCQDKYFRTFDKLDEFGEYHTDLDKQSEWTRLSVSSLQILPLDEELATEPARFPYSSEDAIKDTMMNIRFPGYRFDSGYMDHSMSSATFIFPSQKADLLGEYEKHLLASGVTGGIASLTPGIRFTTSDAGVSCASVSAMFIGGSWPINIGTVVSVKHRGQTTVSRFRDEAEGVFAKFQDTVKALSDLLDIYVQYPVSAMELICRKIATPKKETAEAISIFEMTYGGGACSAHEIYMAMQEILFFMKANGAEPARLFKAEESITRALTFRWEDFDVARAA